MNDEKIPLDEMITGAVLSGGSSARFGSDKGLVKLDGEPMVLHVARVLSDVADEVLVAVAPGKSDVYSEALGRGIRVIEDSRSGLGPLQGLITALDASGGEEVLVSPCDTPLLRRSVCSVLLERGKGKDGAVPRIRGFFEPLHACYARDACLEAFVEALGRGKRKPKDAYHLLDLSIVEESELRAVDGDLESFVNVNSPEDYDYALQLHSHRL